MSKLLEEMKDGPTLVLTVPDDVNLLGIMAAQRASNKKLCLYDARAHTDVKYAIEGMASYALVQRLKDNKNNAENELKIVNPFKKGRGRGRGRICTRSGNFIRKCTRLYTEMYTVLYGFVHGQLTLYGNVHGCIRKCTRFYTDLYTVR